MKSEELFQAIQDEINFSTARSGGPGGQNVNKVNSKVILKWNVLNSRVLTEDIKQHLLTKLGNKLSNDGELILTSQSTRSQLKNKEEALAKLRDTLRKLLAVPKKRKATKPSATSKKKRMDDKKRRGEKKEWRKKLL